MAHKFTPPQPTRINNVKILKGPGYSSVRGADAQHAGSLGSDLQHPINWAWQHRHCDPRLRRCRCEDEKFKVWLGRWLNG